MNDFSIITNFWLWTPSLVELAPKLFEPIATLLSCFGAHVVSRHGHDGRALVGWQAWVCAGVLWISFAVFSQHWFMAITQAYFMYTAIQGRRNTVRNMVADREAM